nr:hypothetical protein [Eggerthella sinensis]
MAEKEMKVVFERPHALLPVVTNYCPGCSHGIVNRLVAECLDELDVEGETVGIAPVGCTVTSYDFYGCDMIEAAHGRAPAVATAVKRVLPDGVVFAYQATATSPASAWPRPCTRPRAARTSPSSSSTTPSTA